MAIIDLESFVSQYLRTFVFLFIHVFQKRLTCFGNHLSFQGQWGTPIVTAGSVFGIIAGVISSILESVGDYHACARISSVPKPPHHAINRGILMEGIACICAGAWGTGIGVTSYSECVGNIGLTRVSRYVLATVLNYLTK